MQTYKITVTGMATYIIQASNRKAAENQTADRTELDII